VQAPLHVNAQGGTVIAEVPATGARGKSPYYLVGLVVGSIMLRIECEGHHLPYYSQGESGFVATIPSHPSPQELLQFSRRISGGGSMARAGTVSTAFHCCRRNGFFPETTTPYSFSRQAFQCCASRYP
jgi:hypothetical protein